MKIDNVEDSPKTSRLVEEIIVLPTLFKIVIIIISSILANFLVYLIGGFIDSSLVQMSEILFKILTWLILSLFALVMLYLNIVSKKRKLFWQFQLDLFLFCLCFFIPYLVFLLPEWEKIVENNSFLPYYVSLFLEIWLPFGASCAPTSASRPPTSCPGTGPLGPPCCPSSSSSWL